MVLLWLLPVGLVLTLLVIGFALSHRLTDRHEPKEHCSPADIDLKFEDICFPATDGLTLRGWWVPCTGADKVIIQLHGYAGSMDPDIIYLPALHAAGLNVLMFDCRAHGRSDGKISTIGYLERLDALGAVHYARSRGMKRIGLLGFSMGARVAILTAPLTPDVDGVVADCGPARLSTAATIWGMESGAPRWLARLLAWLALVVTSLRVGANIFHYEPVDWIGKIAPRPVLLIQGDKDPYVPDFEDLVKASGEGCEVWQIAGMGHTEAVHKMRDVYMGRIVAFFKKSL
jgi:uncharacterized protein